MDRLAWMMALAKEKGIKPPERSIYLYGIDPTGCDALRRIREINPDTIIRGIDLRIPAKTLLRLKGALSFCCPEDIVAALSHQCSLLKGKVI